jgi:hypothetical protein
MNKYSILKTACFIKTLLISYFLVLIPAHLFSQDWNNCGKNAFRNGLSPIPGPDGPSILWQGTEPGLFGFPIYIEGNILVTSRFTSLNYSPVVCHDLYTGQLLWTADVTNGTGRSIPMRIRNGKVYVMRFLEGIEWRFSCSAGCGNRHASLDSRKTHSSGNHDWMCLH